MVFGGLPCGFQWVNKNENFGDDKISFVSQTSPIDVSDSRMGLGSGIFFVSLVFISPLFPFIPFLFCHCRHVNIVLYPYSSTIFMLPTCTDVLCPFLLSGDYLIPYGATWTRSRASRGLFSTEANEYLGIECLGTVQVLSSLCGWALTQYRL